MTSSIINRFSTIATDPLRNFRFYAEFETAEGGTEAFSPKLKSAAGNVTGAGSSTAWVGGFSYINGLNMSVTPIQYREGGYNTTVHQVPGMVQFAPVTLQRGLMYGNDQAITWMRGLFASAAGDGLPMSGKTFRVNITVYVMDHPNAGPTENNKPRMGFRIHNAWLSSVSYTDLNAASNEIMYETMTLVHEGISMFFTDSDGTNPFKELKISASTTSTGTAAV
jgi:phage tail-like protein